MKDRNFEKISIIIIFLFFIGWLIYTINNHFSIIAKLGKNSVEIKKLDYNPLKDSLIYNFIKSNLVCTEISKYEENNYLTVKNDSLLCNLYIHKKIPFKQVEKVDYDFIDVNGQRILADPNLLSIENKCSQTAADSLINFLRRKYKL